jgi:predicted DNA-binding transcriptional regulator AlpA
MQNDRYMNRAEVQEFLGGRSRSALYVDVAAGRLPKPRRLGGRIYWLRSELEAAMKGGENVGA